MIYEGNGKSKIGRLKKNQYKLCFQIEQEKLDNIKEIIVRI